MKKSLTTLLLVTFIIVGFTGKSWAFGSRGHHHNGHGSSSSDDSGDSFFTDNTGNGNTDNTDNNGFNSDFILPNDPGTDNGNSDQGDHDWDRKHHHDHDWDGNVDNNRDDPHAAPVPEPMTLSLLGTGLAGMFLRRKKS